MSNSKYDWEAIFRDYRKGVLTVREVARKHGVDPSYMTRQCKKKGVIRDLSARVQEAVQSTLVHKKVHSEDKVSDDKIVEEAAKEVVNVIETHRKDILQTREREQDLLDELKRPIKTYNKWNDGELEEVNVTVSTMEKSMILNNLTSVQQRRIQMERQAYGLNDLNDPNNTLHTQETIYIDPGEHVVDIDGNFVNGDPEDGES